MWKFLRGGATVIPGATFIPESRVVPAVCFTELVQSGLWAVLAEQYAPYILFLLQSSQEGFKYTMLLKVSYIYNWPLVAWYIWILPGYFGAEIECMVHIALPKRPINHFELVQ
mgnify:CR=1 FL=1